MAINDPPQKPGYLAAHRLGVKGDTALDGQSKMLRPDIENQKRGRKGLVEELFDKRLQDGLADRTLL